MASDDERRVQQQLQQELQVAYMQEFYSVRASEREEKEGTRRWSPSIVRRRFCDAMEAAFVPLFSLLSFSPFFFCLCLEEHPIASPPKERERKEEKGNKEETKNIDFPLAQLQTFSLPSSSNKKKKKTDRPRQVLREVRHEALDRPVLRGADLPLAVLRPVLGRDAAGAQVGARAVGPQLSETFSFSFFGGVGEREREREKSALFPLSFGALVGFFFVIL